MKMEWSDFRLLCERYGLEVLWDVQRHCYKVYVWSWEYPHLGIRPLGYLTLDELKTWGTDRVEGFVVSCSVEALTL